MSTCMLCFVLDSQKSTKVMQFHTRQPREFNVQTIKYGCRYNKEKLEGRFIAYPTLQEHGFGTR